VLTGWLQPTVSIAVAQLSWTVQAATVANAGGPFGSDETLSVAGRNALWPSIAMTSAGEAVAAWITNTDGSGSGQVAAALHPAG
jgi:hypothetical protein